MCVVYERVAGVREGREMSAVASACASAFWTAARRRHRTVIHQDCHNGGLVLDTRLFRPILAFARRPLETVIACMAGVGPAISQY